MSQEKVEKRKYEKKNRKKIERQKKIKGMVKCLTTALVIGALVGIPLGIKIYKSQPTFVGDSVLSAYVGNYIDEHYAAEVSGLGTENAEDTEEATSEDEVTKAVEEAVGEDLETVDSSNIDEVLGTDSDSEATTEE